MQIQLEHVWKGYRLKSTARKLRGLPAEWLVSPRSASERHHFWALRDVTLSIQPGESLGIVGRNGAGKTTILRLMAGVTYPTGGWVKVRGSVGALIDVGAGMHPELTGRENVHLFGAILGLSRRQIRQRFDAIVDFSELEKFLDLPLKWYSSGMKVRLGYAVVAFLHPDVLLVDEVLAVGDIGFQRKCMNHIQMLHQDGSTIVFVSHALRIVQFVCQRTAWLEEGQIVDAGPSAEIIRRYRDSVEEQLVEQTRVASERSPIRVEKVVVTDTQGARRSEFSSGEDLNVNIRYAVQDAADGVEFFLKIVDGTNRAMTVARSGPLARRQLQSGQGGVRCVFPSLPLGPGNYHIWGRVVSVQDDQEEVAWQPMAVFAVPMPDAMERSWREILPWETPLLTLPTRWTLDGVEAPVTAESNARPIRDSAQTP